MDFTSSYFFPNSPHLIKNIRTKDCILLHKNQIRQYLSHQLSSHESHQRTKTEHSIGRVVGKSIKDVKEKKKSFQINKKKDTLPADTIKIFKLVDKVRKLKSQEQEMIPNPFYRIQKKRYPHLRKSFKLRESQLSQVSQNNEMPQKIFKNASLSRAVEEKMGFHKDHSLTYYQMRNYFQNKYGEGRQNWRAKRNKSSMEH